MRRDVRDSSGDVHRAGETSEIVGNREDERVEWAAGCRLPELAGSKAEHVP